MYKSLQYITLLACLLGNPIITPDAYALTKAEIEARKNKKTRYPSPKVGRTIAEAFELYQLNDVDGAIKMLTEVSVNKAYDRAYLNKFIGNLYATQDDPQSTKLAIEYMKRAVTPDVLNYKEQAECIKILAQLYMMTKQYQNAIDYYKKWMSFTAIEEAKIYTRIASSYFELGQYNNIIFPANKAIELSGGTDATAYSLKLGAYLANKDYVSSAKLAMKLYELNPKDGQRLTTAAMSYYRAKEYKLALETFNLANEKGFLTKQSHHLSYAKMHAYNDMPEQCIKMVESYLQNDDFEAGVGSANTQGFCHEKAKNYLKAAEHYKKAYELSEKSMHALKHGEMLLKGKKYRQSIEALNNAMDIMADDTSKAQLYLAKAHYHLKQWKQADANIKLAAKDENLSAETTEWQAKIDKLNF